MIKSLYILFSLDSPVRKKRKMVLFLSVNLIQKFVAMWSCVADSPSGGLVELTVGIWLVRLWQSTSADGISSFCYVFSGHEKKTYKQKTKILSMCFFFM